MKTIKNDRILYQGCPLCRSKNCISHENGFSSKHELHEKKLNPIILWLKCRRCGHIFTDGYHSKDASNILFEKKGNEKLNIGHNLEQNRIISARIIETVLPFCKEGIWLDVGFGNASLLFTAQEYGFEPVGVDLRLENVRLLQTLGLEAHGMQLEDVDKKGQCSVLSLMDVLEHVPFPKKLLATVHSLLEENGILLLSMPNADSMVWKILNHANANPYWNEIEHYHNFGKKRLYALLRECNFKPLRYGVSERYRIGMEVIAIKS